MGAGPVAYTLTLPCHIPITPKEYGLGTEEDHYQEEGETTSDTFSVVLDPAQRPIELSHLSYPMESVL
jgi:hypothetical protein